MARIYLHISIAVWSSPVRVHPKSPPGLKIIKCRPALDTDVPVGSVGRQRVRHVQLGGAHHGAAHSALGAIVEVALVRCRGLG